MLRTGLVLVAACRATSASDAVYLDPVIDESSGLVASRTHPGVFWTHNDSGDGARLFAVDADGRLLREVPVEGAVNRDWEDVALDDAGHLWVADVGNNGNDRRDLTVYRVPEPDPGGAGPVAVDRVVRVTYPEQTAYHPEARNFDAESLFWWEGTLWLFTKHRADQDTVLYRFPALEGDVALEAVGRLTLGGDPLRFGGMATAADAHPSGAFVALLTYHALFVLGRPEDGRSWTSNVVHVVPFDATVVGQCEGVAWDGWSVVITNEGRRVLRVADPFRAPSFP